MHASNSLHDFDKHALVFSFCISSWQAFIFALSLEFGVPWPCFCCCSPPPLLRALMQLLNSEQESPRQASIFSSKQARALASTFLPVSSCGPCCCPCPDCCWSPLGMASKHELNSAQVALPKQTSNSLRLPIPLSHFLCAASRTGDFASACVIFPALNRPKKADPNSFSMQASHSGGALSSDPRNFFCSSMFLRSSSLSIPWSLAQLKQVSWFTTQNASQSALPLQPPGPEVILYLLAISASCADINPACTAKSTHSSMCASS